jgi:hypothetical protein
MSYNINSPEKHLSDISIRSFRAIDDLDSCMRFREGHLGVLEAFGFKLTSSTEDWMFDPGTHVIIIESLDRKTTYGGSRLQLFGSKLELPIQSAVGEDISNLDEYLFSRKGPVAELCGLWNSVAVAGLGIGSVYSIRSAIALGGLLGYNEMIALCSAFTYRISHKYGFRLVESLGEGGKIFYDGANQYAHITHQQDIINLPDSDEIEKLKIQEIRLNPISKVDEIIGDGLTSIHYQIQT